MVADIDPNAWGADDWGLFHTLTDKGLDNKDFIIAISLNTLIWLNQKV